MDSKSDTANQTAEEIHQFETLWQQNLSKWLKEIKDNEDYSFPLSEVVINSKARIEQHLVKEFETTENANYKFHLALIAASFRRINVNDYLLDIVRNGSNDWATTASWCSLSYYNDLKLADIIIERLSNNNLPEDANHIEPLLHNLISMNQKLPADLKSKIEATPGLSFSFKHALEEL